MQAQLPFEDFKKVVANTPLVAIDLLVRDALGLILVGMRTNPPAQGFWFVPGGRIRKNEPLDLAFSRLTQAELDMDFSRSSSRLFGVFEHFYEEDFSGDASSGGTHYVVLAYEIRLTLISSPLNLPLEQHARYRWLTDEQVLSDSSVHKNTQVYCKSSLPSLFAKI